MRGKRFPGGIDCDGCDWFALIDFLESEWSILELLTIPLSGQFFSLQKQVHPRP
jgi:hypothetical protein